MKGKYNAVFIKTFADPFMNYIFNNFVNVG